MSIGLNLAWHTSMHLISTKFDQTDIVPINSILLFQMHAKTSVAISPDFTEDKLWLNGKWVP